MNRDIKIPVVEETLANKFVDEDVVKAEVRAKAKAEILGEAILLSLLQLIH